MNEYIKALNKGLKQLSIKGMAIPQVAEANMYGPLRGFIVASHEWDEIEIFKEFGIGQLVLKIYDVKRNPPNVKGMDEKELIFFGACLEDGDVNDIVRALLIDIKHDISDMESIGYEQIGFTQFRRKTPEYEYEAKRVFESRYVENLISAMFFSNQRSATIAGGWRSPKHLLDAAVEYEKLNLDETGFDSMNDKLRDLIVQHE